MLKSIDIIINSFAQEKLDIEKLILWFESLSLVDKRKTIVWTRNYLEQSHPDHSIINIGIEQIPIKHSITPIVLLKTKSLKVALDKIVELPDAEMKKSFISLVTLFKVSDKKRREVLCKGKCEHDWHNLDKLNIILTDGYLENLKGKID